MLSHLTYYMFIIEYTAKTDQSMAQAANSHHAQSLCLTVVYGTSEQVVILSTLVVQLNG